MALNKREQWPKEAAQAPGPRQGSVVPHGDSSGNFYSGIWLRVARAVEGPRRVGFVHLLACTMQVVRRNS